MITKRLIDPMIALPRAIKRTIVVAVDAALCILTVWLAFYLRLGEWVALSNSGWPAAVVSVLAIPIFWQFGLYRVVFRYIDWLSLGAISQAVFTYGLLYAAIFVSFGVDGVPRTVGLIQPILLLIAITASRAFGRFLLGGGLVDRLRRRQKRNALIYGAGSAGRQLASAFAESPETRIVGFVDDQRNLRGSVIQGVKVWSSERLDEVVPQLEVSDIYLAIPSATRKRRNEILMALRNLEVAVRTLPGLMDLASGKVTISDLRPLEIEDLLGREPVEPDQGLLRRNIANQVVLVTGAGGSIGSELCRQILAIGPRKLLLVDLSEYALYAVHKELERLRGADEAGGTQLVPLLASVCDEKRMHQIVQLWRPDTVYHAAAYKHVPLVEHNVCEGVRNNVIGTWVCGREAHEHRVKNFVLISTDKAVRPTNVMGASKRLAEMVLQALAAESPSTCFAMVRFGNVLGSSGSVVPLFRQQIAAGGPVTVTHREITRYFMTIPEAAQLVLQAGAMAKGGEVFVLDMAEPVRIVDLAVRMIELAGLRVRDDANPDGDIDIEFTGLRPGEKLYEELLIGDNPVATTHPRVMMASEAFLPLDTLAAKVNQLRVSLEAYEVERVLAILCDLVPEYQQAAAIVDWAHGAGRPAPERQRDQAAV